MNKILLTMLAGLLDNPTTRAQIHALVAAEVDRLLDQLLAQLVAPAPTPRVGKTRQKKLAP